MTSRASGMGFSRRFVRGLAILLPSVLTLWLLWQIGLFVFQNVAKPINAGIRVAIIEVLPRVMEPGQLPPWFDVSEADLRAYVKTYNQDPGHLRLGVDEVDESGEVVTRLSASERHELVLTIRRERLSDYWRRHPWWGVTGLVVAISLIYFVGLVLGNFIGRKVYERVEALVTRMPGFKQIYPHVKQVVDLVMGEQKVAFKDVVIVEYPSPGIWSLGFITGDGSKQFDKVAGERLRTVFVPTTPTPFTGYAINVPESRLHRVNLSLDQALRFAITGGVLSPDQVLAGKAGAIPTGPVVLAGPGAMAGPGTLAEPSEPGTPPGGDRAVGGDGPGASGGRLG